MPLVTGLNVSVALPSNRIQARPKKLSLTSFNKLKTSFTFASGRTPYTKVCLHGKNKMSPPCPP